MRASACLLPPGDLARGAENDTGRYACTISGFFTLDLRALSRFMKRIKVGSGETAL